MRKMIAGVGKRVGLERLDWPEAREKKRAMDALDEMVAALILAFLLPNR
jgi:hypothetical protein